MQLGKGVLSRDSRDLMTAQYLAPSRLPTIPPRYNAGAKVKAFHDMGNVDKGDCVPAAAGHHTQIWTAANGHEFEPTTAQVLGEYRTYGGYRGTDATDNGTDPRVLLKGFQQVGLFCTPKPWYMPFAKALPPHKIAAFSVTNSQSVDALKETIYCFGGAFVGLDLPGNWENVASWALAPPNLTGPYAPDPNSGHMICLPEYDEEMFYAISWGQRVPIHPKWLTSYAEAGGTFALFSPDWLTDGVAPNFIKSDLLQSDLALVTA